MLPRERSRLLHLHLGDLESVDPGHPDSLDVDVQHDLNRLFLRHGVNRLQYPHHEIHGGVIIIVQQHLEERRLVDLLGALGDRRLFVSGVGREHGCRLTRQQGDGFRGWRVATSYLRPTTFRSPLSRVPTSTSTAASPRRKIFAGFVPATVVTPSSTRSIVPSRIPITGAVFSSRYSARRTSRVSPMCVDFGSASM